MHLMGLPELYLNLQGVDDIREPKVDNGYWFSIFHLFDVLICICFVIIFIICNAAYFDQHDGHNLVPITFLSLFCAAVLYGTDIRMRLRNIFPALEPVMRVLCFSTTTSPLSFALTIASFSAGNSEPSQIRLHIYSLIVAMLCCLILFFDMFLFILCFFDSEHKIIGRNPLYKIISWAGLKKYCKKAENSEETSIEMDIRDPESLPSQQPNESVSSVQSGIGEQLDNGPQSAAASQINQSVNIEQTATIRRFGTGSYGQRAEGIHMSEISPTKCFLESRREPIAVRAPVIEMPESPKSLEDREANNEPIQQDHINQMSHQHQEDEVIYAEPYMHLQQDNLSSSELSPDSKKSTPHFVLDQLDREFGYSRVAVLVNDTGAYRVKILDEKDSIPIDNISNDEDDEPEGHYAEISRY